MCLRPSGIRLKEPLMLFKFSCCVFSLINTTRTAPLKKKTECKLPCMCGHAQRNGYTYELSEIFLAATTGYSRSFPKCPKSIRNAVKVVQALWESPYIRGEPLGWISFCMVSVQVTFIRNVNIKKITRKNCQQVRVRRFLLLSMDLTILDIFFLLLQSVRVIKNQRCNRLNLKIVSGASLHPPPSIFSTLGLTHTGGIVPLRNITE